MPFNTALQSPQYALLRKPGYAGDALVSLFSNTVMLAGQVNSNLTLSSGSWASFSYNNVTVGAYTNVYTEQCLLIGHTNDITQAIFYGRIRLAPTSTIIYCNESSQDFGVGDYFWVINSFLPQYRLSRPSNLDPATAIELQDYDQGFSQPWPMVVGLQTAYAGYVNPGTGKLRLAFDLSASYPVASGDSISAYGFFFPAGATVVAGGTSSPIVVVDLSPGEQWGQAHVTGTYGSQYRYFGLKVHDTGSNAPSTGFDNLSIDGDITRGWTCTMAGFTGIDNLLPNTCAVVWRNNEQASGTPGALYGGGWAAVTNKQLTSNVATLTATAHPFAVGQTIIVADVDSTFNGTYVITATAANTFSYAKTHADVGSTACSGMGVVNPNNVLFTGWLQSETDNVTADPNFTVTSGASLVFTGVGPRLSRIVAQLLAFTLNASPSLWGQIVNLTVWRALAHFFSRYTTIPFISDLTFDDTSNTFLFPTVTTQGGNFFASPSAIAAQINALLEFAPWGGIAVNREVAYLSQAQRNTLTVVANWQNTDGSVVGRTIDPMPNVGRADGDGLFYNNFSGGIPTGYTVRAPGFAQGEAQGTSTLSNQILAATSDAAAALVELEQRIGNKFEYDNLSEFLDVDHPDSYVGLPFIPSRAQLITWTIDATLAGPNGVNRIIYDTTVFWTVDTARVQYSAQTGSFTVKVRYRRVPRIGDLGDNTTQVDPGSIQPALPDLGLPAFDFQFPEITFPDLGLLPTDINPTLLLPPPDKVAKFDGSELVVKSASKAFYLKNFIALKTPQSRDVTPPDLGGMSIRAILIDPFFTDTLIPCYILGSDGTNSAIWHCTNVVSTAPAWTKGTNFFGDYTILRAGNAAGSIMAYTIGFAPAPIDPCCVASDWAIDFNFALTGSQQGWTAAGGFSASIWVGDGFQVNNGNWNVACDYDFGTDIDVRYIYTFASQTLANDFTSENTNLAHQSPFGGGTTQTNSAFFVGNQFCGACFPKGGTPPGPLSNGCWPVRFLHPNIDTRFSTTQKIIRVIVCGQGTPPAYSPGNANTRYSSDYGASVSNSVIVGDRPGSGGGFDVQRAGGVNYGAGINQVYKSTSLGGAYSPFFATPAANPTCLIIPYYKRNSTTKNTNIPNPDVLVGTDAGKLYWVDGGSAYGTDITPPGSTLIDNPNAVTTSYGHHIACFASVSGTTYLFTSTTGGASWVQRSSLSAPHFIRSRRNDIRAVTSGTNKGQIYLATDGFVDYSSIWAGSGMNIRNMPTSGIDGLDTIW